MYFIEEGRATLLYGDEKVPVKKNDFMYLPAGIRHGLANSSDAPARVIVMGYRIPTGTKIEPTPGLMLANADDVPLQVLASHGPTTQFKLLMGLTSSTARQALLRVCDGQSFHHGLRTRRDKHSA